MTDWVTQIDREGFSLVRAVFSDQQVTEVLAGLVSALHDPRDEAASIRSREGSVYAARNVLSLFPAVRDVWRREPLPQLLREVVGTEAGLVRVLYFDKPPDRTWSLPWHKDLTIAVREKMPRGERFSKPTFKAGVPHVEAPLEVLEAMLTLRIHLDDVTDENGPLEVVTGSHRTGKVLKLDTGPVQTLLADHGDVLAIRPLVAHASGKSYPGTPRHRRLLHLEFAASADLPDGYHWHDFIPIDSAASTLL
jgi:hypothetical protein